MIQLTYQPAYDPYHTILRLLRLLMNLDGKEVHSEQIKLLDFYLAFPVFLKSLHNFKSKVRRAGLEIEYDGYVKLPSKQSIFQRMTPSQDAALQTLFTRGIIDLKSAFVFRGTFVLNKSRVPEALVSLVHERNSLDADLINFLVTELFELPLVGEKSLKARSGLMEYRYDYV